MKKASGYSLCILSLLFLGWGAKLEAQNYVTTYAGTGIAGFVNGDTSIASFNRPFGIRWIVSRNDELYSPPSTPNPNALAGSYCWDRI